MREMEETEVEESRRKGERKKQKTSYVLQHFLCLI